MILLLQTISSALFTQRHTHGRRDLYSAKQHFETKAFQRCYSLDIKTNIKKKITLLLNAIKLVGYSLSMEISLP